MEREEGACELTTYSRKDNVSWLAADLKVLISYFCSGRAVDVVNAAIKKTEIFIERQL